MESKELETQLGTLQTELKTYFDKAAEEKKAHGTMLEQTATKMEAIQKQVDAIDVKLAQRHAEAQAEPNLEETLKASESVQKLIKHGKGSAFITLEGKQVQRIFERKTTITSGTGSLGTAPVVGWPVPEFMPGIVPEARQVLTIRDLLSARPTTAQLVGYIKVSTPMAIGSPQTEGSAKAENAVVFAPVSEKVRTLATWIPASRQVLDDFGELAGFINTSLPYYVNLEEELQLLSGDGTGENLDGLLTQGTAFSTSLLSSAAGWNRIDIIGRTIQQVMAAKELAPTFVVLHPNDWWAIRLTKDSYGRYILGDPQMPMTRPNIFGLDLAVTTSIASGKFLVGSGSPIASEIRDRMEMQVEISTEHSDYFVKNLVAIRAEKRLVLVVKRPASYIQGTFTTSPIVAGA